MVQSKYIQEEIGGNRAKKVGSVVHRELSSILQNRISDPRIGKITITEVVMSRDLRQAKVYATSSESSEDLQNSLMNLNRAKSYIRQQLSANLTMKYTPMVEFVKDEVPERSNRVINLIEKVSGSSDE